MHLFDDDAALSLWQEILNQNDDDDNNNNSNNNNNIYNNSSSNNNNKTTVFIFCCYTNHMNFILATKNSKSALIRTIQKVGCTQWFPDLTIRWVLTCKNVQVDWNEIHNFSQIDASCPTKNENKFELNV